MEDQPPDAGTGDALPMQTGSIMADVTPGVVYNADWYMAYVDGQPYDFDRLWFSNDYGKTWEVRDKPVYQSRYYVSDFEGLIYRTGGDGTHKSTDYAETFVLINNKKLSAKESGLKECEFFALIGRGFYHTYDCFENYINITIDPEYVYGNMSDVFRGGLPGEVYIDSWFPNNIYKVSFSADTGYHFRVVHQRQGSAAFMSDRKARDFHIVTSQAIETQQPWGFYAIICVEHYTDYGETLANIYYHELQRHYPSVDCLGIMDLQAKVENENNVLLSWEMPETNVAGFYLYRNGTLIKELQENTYFDENLPDGDHNYYVKALYANGCESLSYNVAKITIQTVGIGEMGKESDIVVYPNPSNGELQVTSYKLRVMSIEIFDLLGKSVGTNLCVRPETETIVNISHLPSGMYFLRIQTDNGIVTKKIIKQ